MSERSTETKIRIENVYKIFGPDPQSILERVKAGASKKEILDETGHTIGIRDVSLEIHTGEIYVVMGLSGSGKSTLIRHINRLIEPTDGRILVDGEDVLKMNAEELRHLRRYKMSMVFQRFALLPHKTVVENVLSGLMIRDHSQQGFMPHKTVLENIAKVLRIGGASKPEAYDRAMQQIKVVGLEGFENQYPSQLSGGMQQRVGLARALATDADVLLMDEAFSALDPLIRTGMQDQLLEIQKTLNKTIVFITHDLDEALRIGDHIAILKDGELRQAGTPEEILRSPADDYVREFVDDVNRARVLTAGSAKVDSVVVPETASPEEVLELLKDADAAVTYVVDGKGKLLGALSDTRARRAAKAEAKDIKDAYEPVPAAAADMVLEEALPLTLQSDYPLAVLDENGKPIGSLSKDKIIEALSETIETTAA